MYQYGLLKIKLYKNQKCLDSFDEFQPLTSPTSRVKLMG